MTHEQKELGDGRVVDVCHGAAGEVKVGDVLVMDGEIVHVAERKFGPPREGEVDRQMTIYFTEHPYEPLRGDEGQSVYWLVE